MMKRFKSIFLFLGIFFFGQWIIVIALNGLLAKSSMRFSELYFSTEEMQNEMICIGNSRGVNSFYAPYINSKYSVDAYNLSYNGLTIPMIDIVLSDYLKKNSNPQTIFIELSNIFVPGSSTKFSEFNLYSAKSPQLKDQIRKTDKNCHLISSLFPLYRYNSELLYRSLFYTLKSTDQDWINRYTISEEMEDEVSNMPSVELKVEDEDLNDLKSIIDRLEAKNIEVCLFIAPYLPSYLKKIENLEAQIENMEKSLGVSIVDISALLSESKYFADRVHTNEAGAAIIGDTLISLMPVNGVNKQSD